MLMLQGPNQPLTRPPSPSREPISATFIYTHNKSKQTKQAPTFFFFICKTSSSTKISTLIFLSYHSSTLSLSLSLSVSSFQQLLPFLLHHPIPSPMALLCCLAIFCLALLQSSHSAVIMSMRNHHNTHHHSSGPMIHTNQTTCAMFAGTWVQDDSYPMYQSSECPLIIDPEFNCQMYGRPDSEYLKYRWRPLNCELPR